MSERQPLNITIFGVGAMGTLFGSLLHPVANVTLFGHWQTQIETIQKQGVTITHYDGQTSHHKIKAADNLSEIPPTDIALILVKSHQTTRAAKQAAQVLKPDGFVLTLQNGLGNLDTLAEVIGPERAALGITTQGATVTAPGQLRYAGGGLTHLADTAGLTSRLYDVVQLFNRVGIETVLAENGDSLVWGKLAINAGINPLTALLEVPNGALFKQETWRNLMTSAAREVAQVAAAQGISMPFADAGDKTADISQATASNRSSMLQDMTRAMPTEIEAISGAIVRFGRKFGIPTPVNTLLLQLVKDKEAGRLTSQDVAKYLTHILEPSWEPA